MPELTNAQIAAALDELGDLYDLDGAIIHRVVAYRNAAKVVRDSSRSVAALAREGRAAELPGIGKTLQEKLTALLETGDIPSAVKLREKFPPGLVQMTRLPGLGPKRARRLFEELGIDSIDALRAAAEAHKIRELKGLGEKAEESILTSLEAGVADEPSRRTLLSKALAVGEAIVDALRSHPASDRVELAGSARRWSDDVKDLDIIATADDPGALVSALAELPFLEEISRSGEAGARAITHTGLNIDLRIVAPDQFGNLLQHFTGSREHNMALREAAVRKGLHVSEYGVLDDATGETLKCRTEKDVYKKLGLAYIEPELRENRGELEAAAKGAKALPKLLTIDDIRGDLHSHTVASDGRNTIEQMAMAAKERGLAYLAITDHSATHGFGDDVQPDELRRQIERVHGVDAKLNGFKLLAGTEVNIQTDGTPDYADDVLEQLDWVVGSVHTSFRMTRKNMTQRMITAMEHPLVDAIGHPTGRLIGRRTGYDIDMEAIIEAAQRTGTFLEINANPNRRDLNDTHARAAAEAGALIVVNTDAHGCDTLVNMRYGIATARRGWLTADHVANTRTWAQLNKLRKTPR